MTKRKKNVSKERESEQKELRLFCVGEKVVHIPVGVCIVEEIKVIKHPDSEKKECYKLVSVMDPTYAVYIPVCSSEKSVRKLRTKKEIFELLEIQQNAGVYWEKNDQKRSKRRKMVLQDDDGTKLVKLIKTYRCKMMESYLNSADRNWLRAAEQYFYSEVAEVLGIQYNQFFHISWMIDKKNGMCKKLKYRDRIIYKMIGVCVVSRREKFICGGKELEYYRLESCDDKKHVIYIPVENNDMC